MKVREVRDVVHRLKASAARRNATETVQALGELAAILEPYNDQTVAAFAKRFEQRGQAPGRRPHVRQRVR